MPTHASLHAGVRALPDVGHALGCKFEKVGVVYCSVLDTEVIAVDIHGHVHVKVAQVSSGRGSPRRK